MMRRLPALAAVLLLPAAAATAAGPAAPEPDARAHLLAERAAVAPGDRFHVALRLETAPGWHTYWRNPGDSGTPTEIEWTLPEGAAAGPILWPAPQIFPLPGDLANYGYEGAVLLPVELAVPATARPGARFVADAAVFWVACAHICVAGEAALRVDLPVATAAADDGAGARAIGAALAALPERRRPVMATYEADVEEVRLSLPADAAVPPAPRFVPAEPGIVPHAAAGEVRRTEGGLVLVLPRDPLLAAPPARIEGLLVDQHAAVRSRPATAVPVVATLAR